MKAKLVIPEGWRRVTKGKVREGYLIFVISPHNPKEKIQWREVFSAMGRGNYKVGDFYGVIRKEAT